MTQRLFHTIPDPHHQEDDHADHGGLHRDLVATDATMDRRRMRRLGARWGIGIGALQLLGCGDSITGSTVTWTGTGEGWRHREIAALLGVANGTSRAMLLAARRRLRVQLVSVSSAPPVGEANARGAPAARTIFPSLPVESVA